MHTHPLCTRTYTGRQLLFTYFLNFKHLKDAYGKMIQFLTYLLKHASKNNDRQRSDGGPGAWWPLRRITGTRWFLVLLSWHLCTWEFPLEWVCGCHKSRKWTEGSKRSYGAVAAGAGNRMHTIQQDSLRRDYLLGEKRTNKRGRREGSSRCKRTKYKEIHAWNIIKRHFSIYFKRFPLESFKNKNGGGNHRPSSCWGKLYIG